MPWTTEYIPFDESGYARLNSVRFARSNPQTISVGEGTQEIPGSWLVGDPEQLYPQLAPLIAQRRAADADGRARYDAAFNEGTSNSYQGLDAPNFYQELVKGGMTPEQFVEDWANTYPTDQRSHAPELVTGADGKKYVKHDQHDSKGGLLDKITSLAEPAFALSGSYGLGELASGLGTALSTGAGQALGTGALEAGALAGAPGYGAALESSLAGLGGAVGGAADAAWGVNPQPGGEIAGITNTYTPGEFTGSMLPGGSNSVFGELGGGMVDLGGGAASVAGAGWSPSLMDSITQGISKITDRAAQSAAKTALGKIMNGQGSPQDFASLLGTIGSTALGVIGSKNQSDALTQIANQSRADRAPFLNAATGWLNNPESYYASEPAQAAMSGVLRGLSVNGNPANNPTALATATEAGLRNWQNAVTGFGNIGLSGQDSRNALLSNAAAADRGVTSSLASGIGSLTQPQDDLESMLRRLQATGLV